MGMSIPQTLRVRTQRSRTCHLRATKLCCCSADIITSPHRAYIDPSSVFLSLHRAQEVVPSPLALFQLAAPHQNI